MSPHGAKGTPVSTPEIVSIVRELYSSVRYTALSSAHRSGGLAVHRQPVTLSPDQVQALLQFLESAQSRLSRADDLLREIAACAKGPRLKLARLLKRRRRHA